MAAAIMVVTLIVKTSESTGRILAAALLAGPVQKGTESGIPTSLRRASSSNGPAAAWLNGFPHGSFLPSGMLGQPRLLNEKLLADEKMARFPVQHESFRPNLSLTTQDTALLDIRPGLGADRVFLQSQLQVLDFGKTGNRTLILHCIVSCNACEFSCI